jgi:DNA-binding response OmpR family regulator
MKRILIIEDDHDVVDLVSYQLTREGYQVNGVHDGYNGLAALKNCAPDLLVLGAMLPGVSGMQILGEVRKDNLLNRLPILVLTARCEEEDRVSALEMGADDCVIKPFSPRELTARVKALLWRAETSSNSRNVLKFGELVIDYGYYRVSLQGRFVSLSVLEFRLLYHLALHPECVFTRNQLLDAVWGSARFVTPRSVDVCVRRLREKIENNPANPKFMRTIHGAGYLFQTSTK